MNEPTASLRDLTDVYAWLNIPRLVVPIFSGILILLLWIKGAIDFDPRPIVYGVVPLTLLASVVWAVLIKKGLMTEKLLLPQLFLDMLIVTAGVYFTGGLHSEFVLIYILVVISATLVSFRATLAIGVGAIVSYLLLGWAEYMAILPSVIGHAPGFSNEDVVRISIFMLLVGLIAFQSFFYVSQIRKKNQEILTFKDEFLFRTIHDLRSPSTVLRLVLDKYSEQGALEKFPEAVRQDIDLLQKVTVRIRALIEDILKIAKGEQGEMRFKEDKLDATAILRYCLEELGPYMKEKKVSASYVPQPGLPQIIGDEEKLKEVFNNFLSNATKYNKDGGTVEVSHRVQGKQLVTVIKDSGIGIKKESLQKLFTAYFRGDVDRSIEGTGLGLYFTKKLVEKMGGKIDVDSLPGKGTTFSISLPIAT